MGPGELSLHGTFAVCTCASIALLCTGWPLCGHTVCADSVLVHTRKHTCAWGHAGTCGGTQTHTGSPLVVTSTHIQNRCASHLNTCVLCTLVCFTSCDTCKSGERRVCVHPPHHGVCRESHSCARVPFWAWAPPSVYSRLALSPGPPSSWFSTDGVVFDALVSAVTLNAENVSVRNIIAAAYCSVFKCLLC